MKSLSKNCIMLIAALLFTGSASFAQKANANNNSKTSNQQQMKTYLIERKIPGAGQLTPEQLQGISQKSCSVLDEMGPQIQWDHSYVVGDKIYCVYRATNEELLKEHGQKGGFPVDTIYEVKSIISPATAKSH
jgi:hypothetical protein